MKHESKDTKMEKGVFSSCGPKKIHNTSVPMMLSVLRRPCATRAPSLEVA